MPAPRPSVRADNRAATRRRVLDGAVAVVTERGDLDFTMQDVVDRCGVPLRTVYRHFARRSDLVGALADEADQAAVVPLPDDLDGYEAWLVAAWQGLVDREVFIRAQHTGPDGIAVRRARTPLHRDVVRHLLARDRPGLDATTREDLVTQCLLLSSSAALFELADVHDLAVPDAARLAAEAIVRLIRSAGPTS